MRAEIEVGKGCPWVFGVSFHRQYFLVSPVKKVLAFRRAAGSAGSAVLSNANPMNGGLPGADKLALGNAVRR
jgi:hypothetical protein